MASDFTKADVPSFIGGNASGGMGMVKKGWGYVLGFFLVLFSLAAAVALSVRAISFTNRNAGTSLALPNALAPARGGGGDSRPPGFDGV